METTLCAWSDVGRELALTPLGFVILAHENFGRVAQLARYLSLHGPVVIHVDAKVSSAVLENLGSRVEVISTRSCRWGMISLVDATLDAVRHLLDLHQVGHVCLLSGSCLPIRPIEELTDFLGANGDVDFIDTTPIGDQDWVQGGLSAERFQYWFPVNWKSRRRLFDLLVWVQRKIGMRRKTPEGLIPHLGLQWWCMSAQTLRGMLDHPDLPRWRNYFAWTWIPDESFFQTLVHRIAGTKFKAQPLTLQRFDQNGQPFVFHDDHADLLASSGYFFARKIDPDADGLYARHLSDMASGKGHPPVFDGKIDETPFEQARVLAKSAGHGLLSASKMTSGTTPSHVETVRPYAVIVSQSGDLMREVRRSCLDSDIRFHGRLFGVFPSDFADDFPEIEGLGPGCLPTEQTQRNYRAAQYLAKVLWVGRDRPAAFLFDPSDHAAIRGTIFSDANARLILMGDPQALLLALGLPLRNRRGKPMRPSIRRAWHRSIAVEDETAVAQALEALSSDWDDPSVWTLPPADLGSSS